MTATHTLPPTQDAKRRIFIVDDHPIVRLGLANLLVRETDIEMCGSAEDGLKAMEQVKAARPDLVVIDISLKTTYGLALIAQIREFDPRIKMLVWSMFDERLYAERVLRAGAWAISTNRNPSTMCWTPFAACWAARFCLSPPMTDLLLHRLGGGEVSVQDPIETLSNRELEVLQMIGRGLTTQHIAQRLQISGKTIEGYRENIKKKLNLKNSAELNRRAFQWALENR